MSPLLNEEITAQVKEIFDAQLPKRVALLFFGSQKIACDYCEETRQLLQEVALLSPQLELSIHDLDDDAELASQYHVTRVPTVVIASSDEQGNITDHGIRFAGLPAGHEFAALINTLLVVGRRDSGLGQKVRDFLKTLQQPVNLLVFSTTT